jgi:hypothetical protein
MVDIRGVENQGSGFLNSGVKCEIKLSDFNTHVFGAMRSCSDKVPLTTIIFRKSNG